VWWANEKRFKLHPSARFWHVAGENFHQKIHEKAQKVAKLIYHHKRV
jgi:hypothetical protein